MLERGEVRIESPDYEGKDTTNQGYMIESNLLPEGYIAPGELSKVLTMNSHLYITERELADLFAWMPTLD